MNGSRKTQIIDRSNFPVVTLEPQDGKLGSPVTLCRTETIKIEKESLDKREGVYGKKSSTAGVDLGWSVRVTMEEVINLGETTVSLGQGHDQTGTVK